MLQSYAEIPPELPEWFWEGWIPKAFACFAAGDGGLGKGNAMSDVAARFTRGDVMPDGTPGPGEGWVIAVTPEDDQRKVMAWRLRAARADLNRVFDLTGKPGQRFKLPADLGKLYQAISAVRNKTGVREGLVLLDPLAAISTIKLTSANTTIREKLVEPLEALAADQDIALVVNGHTTKTGSIAGSVALTQAARMVLKFTRDQDDPAIRRIQVEKSNISRDDIPPVAFRLLEGDPAPTVEWIKDEENVIQLGDAQQKIMDCLKADGPMAAKDIAGKTGISYPVVRVLLRKLSVKGLVDSPERGSWRAAC